MNRKSKVIPFAIPLLGREEERAAVRVLRSGWLTTGKEAKAFEEEFASFVGTSRALAVNSATAGLHLALEAAGIKAGDKVLTTPYTFTATAEVIRYLGADPVFADIDPETFNISPAESAAILKKTNGIKAILPVHIGGYPASMEEFLALKKKYGLSVIEDAAHAFPAAIDGKFLGTWADAGVFSFYATKTITTGEGGMVVTDNMEIADRISIMRLHGIDREIWNRYTSPNASWQYSVVEAGYKYNMPDILAAIGREQLKKGKKFLKKRKWIAGYYREKMADFDFISLPSPHTSHAWHLFIIRIKKDKLKIDRNTFISLMKKEGIGTSVHYIPLHIMPYYRKKYGLMAGDYPVAMNIYETAISLPIYPGLTEKECLKIVKVIKNIGKSNYRGNYGGY